MRNSGKPKLGTLQSPAGRRAGWGIVACFWLTMLAMAAVFVAGGKILDGFLLAASGSEVSDVVSEAATTTESGAGETSATVPTFSGLFPAPANLTLWIAGAVATLLVFLGKFGEAHLETTSQIREENRIREMLITGVFRLGPARVKRAQLGRLVNLATDSSEKFTVYLQSFLPQVKGSFSAPILLVAAMAVFVHPLLAVLMTVCLPVIPLGIVVFLKLFRRSSSGSTRARSALAAAYLDALGGLTTLQLLGAGNRVSNQLEAVGEENRRATMQLLRSNQVVIFVLDTVFSLFAVTSAAVLLMFLAMNGDVTPGQTLTGLGLGLLLLEPIDHFGSFFYIAMGGRGAGRGILEFLGSVPGQRRLQQAAGGAAAGAAHFSTSDDSMVQLEDVSSGYGDRDVLTGVNLALREGERVAVVGASGQGKSTLLNLIKGFIAPTQGQVRVKGRSGKLLDESALVSQNTWLFTGTVRENLAAVAPGASEGELWKALREAHLDAEIRALPDGLDARLGENGAGLSSGQKQRLSLARALVSGRKILLLDEATSQVDLASEREILAALAELGREYTLLMVTHRGRVCELADRVVEVSNGEVRGIE